MITLLLRARERSYVAVYSVYEPPNPPADRIDRAEGMMFIKEGFSWGAALLTPFWLAANQMWLILVGYLAAIFLLTAGFDAADVSSGWTVIAIVALQILMGFEASALERAMLEHQGWTDAGTVSGRTSLDCERRFFDIWLSGEPAVAVIGGDHGAVAPARFRRWRLFGRSATA